jgi:hypothetical protein
MHTWVGLLNFINILSMQVSHKHPDWKARFEAHAQRMGHRRSIRASCEDIECSSKFWWQNRVVELASAYYASINFQFAEFTGMRLYTRLSQTFTSNHLWEYAEEEARRY